MRRDSEQDYPTTNSFQRILLAPSYLVGTLRYCNARCLAFRTRRLTEINILHIMTPGRKQPLFPRI